MLLTSDCDPMYLEYFSSQSKLCCWCICLVQVHLCHSHCPGSLPTFCLSHFYHLRCIWCVQAVPPLSHVHHHPVTHPSLTLHVRGECPWSWLVGSARGLQ